MVMEKYWCDYSFSILTDTFESFIAALYIEKGKIIKIEFIFHLVLSTILRESLIKEYFLTDDALNKIIEIEEIRNLKDIKQLEKMMNLLKMMNKNSKIKSPIYSLTDMRKNHSLHSNDYLGKQVLDYQQIEKLL